MSINTAVSVVDYLTSQKKPSDFQSRLKLAQQYGIQNYAGTADQNTQLLGFLKGSTPPAPAPGADVPAPGTPGGADPAMVNVNPTSPSAAVPGAPAPAPAPLATGGAPAATTAPMEGARLLGPTEYEALRKQNNVGDANFGQFFVKDQAGNIFLRPDAPGPAGGADLETDTFDLNGGVYRTNPDGSADLVSGPAGLPKHLTKEEAAGGGGGTETTVVDKPASSLQDNVDSILKRYGISPPGKDQDPITSFSDVYKQLFEGLGLNDVKSQYDTLTKEYQAIQDELNDKKAEVNENPWITEGQRQDRLAALDARYEGKTNNLTNRMTLLEKMYEQGRQQAQFVASTALQERFRGQQLRQDMVLKAIDLAEGRSDSERRIASDEKLQKERLEAEKKKAATADLAEYEYAKKEGYKGTFQQWQKEQANLKARATGGRALTERERVQGFLETANTALSASRGSDGFVNTGVYAKKYQEYLFRGGSPKDFFDIFPPGQYLNPQDPTAKFYRDKADSDGLGSLAS